MEKEFIKLTSAPKVVCVNSWVSGAMLIMRWFGVGLGDEVIIPSYTYCATALACLNMGAKPIMVDVLDDFTIDPEKLKGAINPNTKVIIPVDLGGLPCDYDKIFKIINEQEIKSRFQPSNTKQKKLGRILILADAAHSIGATYKGKPIASVVDERPFRFIR